MNGKTGREDDFVTDSFDDHSPVAENPCYVRDTPISRNNKDTHPLDQQGKRILEVCKNMSLRILNGRTCGDELGNFTRYPKHSRENPSTIDYALCSTDSLQEIARFVVLPFTGLSDHSCVQFNLMINSRPSQTKNEPNQSQDGSEHLHPPLKRLRYDPAKKDEFKELLSQDGNLNSLGSKLVGNGVNQETIDSCIGTINKSLVMNGSKIFHGALPSSRKSNKPKKKRDDSKAWYTKDCKAFRDVLRRRSKELYNDPFNKAKRDAFVKARTNYKKECKKAGNSYRKLLSRQLLEIGMTNPKLFWDLIQKMNNWGKSKSDDTDGISPRRWIEHFSKLLNNSNERDQNDPTPEFASFDPSLDGKISKEEMLESLAELKKGKSPGPDRVLLEYLIVLAETHPTLVNKLLNKIFSEHIYPTDWTINFLKPIFKKGDKDDTDNFRGLAVGSAFAKLFSQILLKRLTSYINEKGLLSPNQGGFQKNMSTSDLIFLLQTIIDKYVKRGNRKLFVAFIDFKKAYDTVDRDLLLQRLQTLGINGLFLKNITAMYRTTKYAIKLSNGTLTPIDSNLGLKQGCPLSPILFNLYIDDISEIFDSCDPVDVHDVKINHFLYADDLVIISLSERGLQTALNNLFTYSGRKCLSISIKKSKTMIFNKSGRMYKRYFHINGKPLEPVPSFCYLGFDVKASGTVKHAMNTLCEKASKAMRPIFRTIALFNLPVTTSLRIFHAYIEPIALYNAENWTQLTDKEISKFSRNTLLQKINSVKTDIMHRKFLKYVLGTPSSCPNMTMYGDTNEHPLTMKAFRLMLNFWHRVNNLSETTLVKKALLENINIRTNWIKTVEKLLGDLSLTEAVNEETYKFKQVTRKVLEERFNEYWGKIVTEDTGRLNFYKTIKSDMAFEPYLNVSTFEDRKSIARLRSSTHNLHIEQGRHRNIPRESRFCQLCPSNSIETEEHFLTGCTFFNRYKPKYDLKNTNDPKELIRETEPSVLGKYLTEAFSERKKYKEWFSLD